MNHYDHSPGDARSAEGYWEKLSQVAVQGAEYDSPERQPHPQCLEGTRVCLLDHSYGLLDDSEKSQLVWVHGTAGVGKSAVAFTIAERMRGLKIKETGEKRLAGTFFFSRRSTKRCTTGFFFATLAYQLASNFPSIKADLVMAIRENPALLDPQKSLRDQMEGLFLRPLRRLQLRLRECPPLVFVVDALDECTSETEIAILISLLAQALHDPDLPVTHILLTSRLEVHIREAIDQGHVRPLVREIPVKTSGEGVTSLISLDGADVDSDIVIFLKHSFTKLQRRHPTFPQPTQHDFERLASRAGRRFIIASTMMKFIDDGYHDPRDRLQLMLDLTSKLLPGTEVFKLYDHIVSTCTDPERAFHHLSVVAALANPLSVSQISELLGPGEGRDVEMILVQLRSVIDIPTDGSLPVNIYHASVRDYVSKHSNCGLFKGQCIKSPHSLLAYSSFRLMIHNIPESTGLLDELLKLKTQSKVMESDSPKSLRDSLAFMVKPPTALGIIITLLSLRGNHSATLHSWLETPDGRGWLCAQEGQDWLMTPGGVRWLETQAGWSWLCTPDANNWLHSRRGGDWLQSQRGRDWLQSQHGKNWLQSRRGMDWLRSWRGRDWLQSQRGRDRPQSQRGRDRPQSQRSRDRLQSQCGGDWLQLPDTWHWQPEWVGIDTDPECARMTADPEHERVQQRLDTLSEREWLQTQSGRDWLQTQSAREWLRTSSGQEWLQTPSAREWLQTQSAREWLPTWGGQKWLQTLSGREWVQTQSAREWLPTWSGQEWLQTQSGREWLRTPSGREWLQTPSGREWLPTWSGQKWLQSSSGREWLQRQSAQEWLPTSSGQEWLQTQSAREWLQTQSAREWLLTWSGKEWLQTPSGQEWLPTWRGQEWLETPSGQEWLQTQSAREWLQTMSGQEWLQALSGQEWLLTSSGQEWLQTSSGREWLQTQSAREWLLTWNGGLWLQTPSGREWLQTLSGREWLQTQSAREWLWTSRGQKWLQNPSGREWLQTRSGREWLQTPHGRAWQLTPAASFWVCMEEFLDVTEIITDFFIIPTLSSLPVFQIIQQFNTLPDFLMFPVFLALTPKRPTFALAHGPDMEIIHVINAFVSFANDVWKRNQSTSDAFMYACENWAMHLSRAPDPRDDMLNHIFKVFWEHHLSSWLETQWCLRGLRSCLVVLSDGQKLAMDCLHVPESSQSST